MDRTPEEDVEKARGINDLSPSIAHRRAPGGYRLCAREPLPGRTLEETDEHVRVLGGWRLSERNRSSEGGQFYVLPFSAFDRR